MNSTDEKISSTERMLNALDALTKPQHVAEWQGEGDSKTIFKRTDPPLLDWLHGEIVSDTGGNGGGQQPQTRTPIAVAAFTLYEDIDGRVRSWLRDVGGNAGKYDSAAVTLRTWYSLWIGKTPSDHLRDAFTSILDGWAGAIRDVLDPPKRIEITSACPLCGQEWVNIGLRLDGKDDPDDVERVRVLVAVERENINESYAMCRGCKRVWLGVTQMRTLRIAIDDLEAAEEAV